MFKRFQYIFVWFLVFEVLAMGWNSNVAAESVSDYSLMPPFVTQGVPPLVMLVMGRDHKLYYEAYNDISDLNGDGQLDVGYNPDIDYYGYFDSYKTYVYDSTDNRFEPTGVTTDKKVTTSSEWSGDFLNYLTTSRMDAMRKVLYGGYRSTDSTSDTTLQRVYIPQDAHTWGKEYTSIAVNGYDISEYAPFVEPSPGFYHLFASTTLSDNGTPVLRILADNPHRIWEWVAKERPVADDSMESAGGTYSSHPQDATQYDDLVMMFANASHLQGSQAVTQINGSGNPFGDNDYYLNIFDGTLNITTAGTYEFAVDGDDALEVIIDGDVVASWYEGHGKCDCQTHSGTVTLTAGPHTIEFRHQETSGDDNYYLWWNGADSGNVWEKVPASAFSGLTQTVYDVNTSTSTIEDLDVKVQVCRSDMPESNCKRYPNGTYKPVGIFQRHGEADSMYFGLITGSYAKNTSGGVLRKNIGSITDEINSTTGQFTAVNGIINTINTFRTVDFDYGDHSYNSDCGWITTSAISEGQCRMWGNPIGEMMYEGLRYFGGKGPTTDFTYDAFDPSDDVDLGLDQPSWQNPYDSSTGFPGCAKPFMLVLSDVNPSFDSDQLPGVDSTFGPGITSALPGLHVSNLADTISTEENLAGDYFIGQVGGVEDGAPTAKAVTSLANVRGLAPEEPTKQGSYYSASVAYYGKKTDISSAAGDQNVTTYSVALASPLPRIEIFVNGQTITLVPFAKSVGGSSISAAEGDFQPTNTIVDVFMQELTPTYGRFRINFEDVEQGADHDMDAIAIYEYTVNGDNTVTISLTSDYAAGGIIQHMGYVISGTTGDGTYLEIRDVDTTESDDPDYFLDTPPGQSPGGTWADSTALPLSTSRTFTPGTTTAATLLKNPLWYAAKYGGFDEKTSEAVILPDNQEEWDKDADGVPDTYFHVTNPLKLEEQLNKSFADILRRTSSGTAASVISSSRSGEGAIYQSVFWPEFSDPDGNTVNWIGQTHAIFVDSYGNMREDTDSDGKLTPSSDYIIKFEEADGKVKVNKYQDVNGDNFLSATESSIVIEEGDSINAIDFLWSSSNWLNTIADGDILSQRTYTSTDKKRYIFTFVDNNTKNMVPDSGEIIPFLSTETSIKPYIHALPPFDATKIPTYLSDIAISDPADFPTVFADFQDNQRQRVINFIRGQDQGNYTSSTTPSYTIPEFRSRQLDPEDDGSVETWRMGDIVYSSPTVVATPSEDYDLLYKDETYSSFYRKYRHRRNVVYVGGNDGMLHAFNGGFYDAGTKKFWKGYSTTSPYFTDAGPDLGAELWAYVPFNLLPHLYWLTEPSYNSDFHVSYVDMKPRIFDAKIFANDTTHPNGWGTVMVIGMRFGGGTIKADTNGDNLDTGEPTLTSAYIVMDITDPEAPPTLLAELTFPGQGFTTVYPTVVPMKATASSSPNNWYLVFGSGPFSSTHGAGGSALSYATSDQAGKVYAVDLNKLGQATGPEVYSLNSSGVLVAGAANLAAVDSNSFISDPISVDYDLDYKADSVYFGTVSGDYTNGWGGKLRRIEIKNDIDPANWVTDSVLINLDSVHQGQPITAAPTVALSDRRDRFVYFGTGRFFNRNDINLGTASDQQTYYGIKEPYTIVAGSKVYSWTEVPYNTLKNVSDVEVYQGTSITNSIVKDTTGNAGFTQDSFYSFANTMNLASIGGWRLDFSGGKERNVGQGVMLGDVLTFTSYGPSADACEIEGSSFLYALYYKTGTAYYKSIVGLDSSTIDVDDDGDGTADRTLNKVLNGLSLGKGLTMTPNIHVGRQKGSKAFLQTSTGAIIDIGQENPGATKSGSLYWQEE